MTNRDYGQGYRGPHDREHEGSAFARERDDDRLRGAREEWERNRERAEFAGSGENARGRAGEWSERGYRGGSRGGAYRRESQGGPRGGRDEMDQHSEYDRGSQRSRQFGRRSSLGWGEGEPDREDFDRDEQLGRGRQGRDWSARDFRDDEFEYPGEGQGAYRFMGPYTQGRRGADGSRELSEGGRYWGGAAAGYGPSTGYGYGTTGSYLGGPEQSGSARRSEQNQPNFVGRGPRGYKRSDERIREEINERLTRHAEIDASDVDVRVDQCEVVLAGVVEDRKAKRLAEDIAEDVWGVDDVRNELKVRRGFLASLTGEQADDREIARTATRESNAAADKARAARSGTGSSTSSVSTPNPSGT